MNGRVNALCLPLVHGGLGIVRISGFPCEDPADFHYTAALPHLVFFSLVLTRPYSFLLEVLT
jgi:hypothetical protein